MESAEFIGSCGVDCSVCPDLRSEKCPGCRQTVWTEDDVCPPVACCAQRGIPFCGACTEFPCGSMAGFYEESDGHREAYRRMQAFREAGGSG